MATVTNSYNATFTPSLAGSVNRLSVNQTFANIRSGAGTAVDSSVLSAFLFSSSTTNQFQGLGRSIVLFDTSSIPSGATIVSASISATGSARVSTLGTTDIVAVSSNPASTSALAASDYSTLGTTSFGSISSASFLPTGINVFTLNASGLSNITKNGISKFGFVLDWDRSGTFSGTWASTQLTEYDIVFASPVLAVSYTVDFPTLSFNNISSLSNVTTITTS